MELQTRINPIIRLIIDRDCHVGMPYRKVIKHVASRLKGKWPAFKALSREQRRVFITSCCAVHHENRALYRFVVRGRKIR
jgi:hypothetical protein